MAKGENDKFPTVENCVSTGRETQTVVADMDGTLLRGRSSFPYFAILAFELGGIVRMSFLLLAAPLAGLLYYLVSETAGIQVLIFTTFVGAKVSDIESVARAVLPKFYSEDLHPEAWRVFSSCGKRCVLTANPRIMVEAFLRDYLGVDMVIGTEISSLGGRATGFVKSPGVLVGSKKADALEEAMREWEWECVAHVGLGDRRTDFPFMKLCKEGYMVLAMPKVEAVSRDKLPKPIVFHDGRLVHRPTPILTLITIMWFPVGFLLACLRIAAGALLPMSMVYHAFLALGVHVRINGIPPPATKRSGVLFICSHRTLLDPIFLSTAIGRPVSAVTYSVSRVSEWLSPIKTVPLTCERAKDAAMIKSLLEEGDLVICPEGTTCREPFLLRFSALFAELTDQIVPVAMRNEMSMFHGTTARGWKGMDAFYFFMNPTPLYEVTFLNKLPMELTCSGGKTSHEVANYIQRVLAATLSYECTNFTRRDKYKALAGNDGTLAQNKAGAALFPNKLMGC